MTYQSGKDRRAWPELWKNSPGKTSSGLPEPRRWRSYLAGCLFFCCAVLFEPGLVLGQVAPTPGTVEGGRRPAGGELTPMSPRPPFGPTQVRLPLMGTPQMLGKTPKPTPGEVAEYKQFVKKFVDPRNTIDLILGRARLMLLEATPTRVQIGDEAIASYNLIETESISIVGKRIGTTVLNLWFKDPKDKKKEQVLSYLVRVIPDPEEKERLERVYKALSKEINEAFPDSLIKLFLVGDKVVITGQAKDIAEATQILRIVGANAPGGGNNEVTRIPVNTIGQASYVPGDPNAPGGTPGLDNYILSAGPNVINLMRIAGEQQVMLRVTVAEVNRAAARSIGVNFLIRNNQGLLVFGQNTGNLFTGGGVGGGAGGAGGGFAGGGVGGGAGRIFGNPLNNLPVNLDNGQINLAINALRNMNYARSLAEPNLVALNGQTASFQAGGQFPVPIVTGFTGAGLQGVSFVPFGVQLQFTPFITDKDRIRLTVSAEVSTRDVATGTQIQGAAVAGLTTRNFQTTVELREGQTLAVAGLIQNNLGADATRVPLLGDLPLVGNMWGFNRTSSAEQELVVLVTPELVHPMEPKEIPPLPGSDLFEPGDLEFYLMGRLESRRSYDYRATVRTDINRMKAYRRCEQMYIQGPSGYSVGPHCESPQP